MEIEKHEGYAVVRPPAETWTSRQGLPYFVGISGDTVGAKGICTHMVVIPPGESNQAHSHSGFETTIYMLKGTVDFKFGEGLSEVVTLREGQLLYIGPNVWHQPINRSDSEPAVTLVARNDANEQQNVILYDPDNNRAR